MLEKNLEKVPYGVARAPRESLLATHKVLRNTYALLSMTLLFSALMAGAAMAVNAAPLNPILTLVAYLGLFFLTARLSDSAWGLAAVFALTGFMGWTLGPLLSLFMGAYANGAQLAALAMGGTGAIFLGLSGYVLTTRKDFSFIGGFLAVGLLVAFLAVLANLFFQVPTLALTLSAVIVLLMSGFILYDTSRIIHGGETNYIMATVAL
ncbi:MAG TPA: Bax inhibitor-1/YccA family protein, partial [Candidatus Competibacteraceae bacterium]|nr:Bax inhibitor-1/YccA family protein [Candidatus Competibacteraceae bacterium]